jgi:hypothetical protein
MDGGTHHMPPLLSVLLFDCIRKCLIEGPQHSSVRSFVSTHDLMRRPHSPHDSALVLSSLHLSLRGTPLASPSHRVLLCWTLCREDQTTLLRSLLRPCLRSNATAPLSPRQRTSTLLPTVLPSGNNHLPLLRAESCSFADSARRPLNTASPTSPLPELRHGENTHISAAHRRSTTTTSSPHGEPLLATFEQNSTLFVGPQHSSANSSEFAAPLTTNPAFSGTFRPTPLADNFAELSRLSGHRCDAVVNTPRIFLSLGLRVEGPLTAFCYNWSRPSDTPGTRPLDSNTNSAHLPRSPRGINHYFLGISKAALPWWSVMRWHEVSCLHAR